MNSADPIIHRIVELKTVRLKDGGALVYAMLEDGSAIGGGMHGVTVDVRTSRNGRAEFIIQGEVNP